MAAAVQNLPKDLRNFTPGVQLGNTPELASAIANKTGASTQSGITASATQTQAGGTKLVAAINVVTSSGASDAVTLPQALPGKSITIVNSTNQTISIFPFLGDTINAAAANAAVTAATVTTSTYYSAAKGQWWGGATTNEG